MAKWIGNNKAYKRVIKKQLPKVEEIPQENINKEEFKLLDKIIDEIANEMISTL